MKNDSVIQRKSYAFSLRVVKLYQYLIKEHNYNLLFKQILRSGTSIGANVEEASGGYSKKTFSLSYQLQIVRPERHVIG